MHVRAPLFLAWNDPIDVCNVHMEGFWGSRLENRPKNVFYKVKKYHKKLEGVGYFLSPLEAFNSAQNSLFLENSSGSNFFF